MRYLKTGCCGCTLKKSTLIIGYIGIVATLLNLIANGYQLASLDSDQDMLYGEGYSKNEDSFSTIMDDKNPRRLTGRIIGAVISLVVGILLIVGTTKENRYLLLPWIISGAIGIVLLGIAIVMLLIVLIISLTQSNTMEDESNAIGVTIFFIVISLLILTLVIYLWLIVLSHYAELRNGSGETDVLVQMRSTSDPKNSYLAPGDALP